jgi:hypothetical protein
MQSASPANDPLIDELKSTGPVGVLAPLAAVSLTVTVHIVATPSVPDAGRQFTLVLVGSMGVLEPSVKDVPSLPPCVPSPR